jgi:hypothetical protein
VAVGSSVSVVFRESAIESVVRVSCRGRPCHFSLVGYDA